MRQLAKLVLLLAVSVAAADHGRMVRAASAADFDAIVAGAESKKEATTESTTIVNCSPECPFGWVKFDGRCYIYRAMTIDWASAESHCLSLDANLVSIHNENEYQLVKALIRANDPQDKPIWIGLSNCQKRHSWIWSDGTKLTYTKWNSNEPNFYNNECCVHMNYSTQRNWNDCACEQVYNFVCVKTIKHYVYAA